MPQVCSKSSAQPSYPTKPIPRRGSRPRIPSGGDVIAKVGPPLSILNAPSPSLGDTCTTQNQMLFWVGWFARFHLDGAPYVPQELKTLDCPVVGADGTPVLRGDGQSMLMRCAREIALHTRSDGDKWLMISWHLGLPGVTIQECGSAEAALAAFHAPPEAIRLF